MTSEQIKQAIKLSHKRIEDVALSIGYARETLSRKIKDSPNDDTLIKQLESVGIDFSNVTKRDDKGGKPVPYYDIDATAGNVTIFDGENVERVKQYITVPAFSDCDMFINVSGNSMYPKYCSGELIALKKINDLDVISLGEAYLIVTGEQRLLKYIKKGSQKDYLKLVSENENYEEFEIHRKKIIHLYLVKGKITKNAI